MFSKEIHHFNFGRFFVVHVFVWSIRIVQTRIMYLSILSVGPSIDPKQRHVAPENPNFKDASINTEKKKNEEISTK